MGFERNPPNCGNCKNKFRNKFFVKGIGLVNGKPRCSIGGFKIEDNSICDKWKGYRGECLEE